MQIRAAGVRAQLTDPYAGTINTPSRANAQVAHGLITMPVQRNWWQQLQSDVKGGFLGTFDSKDRRGNHGSIEWKGGHT
jgi:hypothetical protein